MVFIVGKYTLVNIIWPNIFDYPLTDIFSRAKLGSQ